MNQIPALDRRLCVVPNLYSSNDQPVAFCLSIPEAIAFLGRRRWDVHLPLLTLHIIEYDALQPLLVSGEELQAQYVQQVFYGNDDARILAAPTVPLGTPCNIWRLTFASEDLVEKPGEDRISREIAPHRLDLVQADASLLGLSGVDLRTAVGRESYIRQARFADEAQPFLFGFSWRAGQGREHSSYLLSGSVIPAGTLLAAEAKALIEVVVDAYAGDTVRRPGGWQRADAAQYDSQRMLEDAQRAEDLEFSGHFSYLAPSSFAAASVFARQANPSDRYRVYWGLQVDPVLLNRGTDLPVFLLREVFYDATLATKPVAPGRMAAGPDASRQWTDIFARVSAAAQGCSAHTLRINDEPHSPDAGKVEYYNEQGGRWESAERLLRPDLQDLARSLGVPNAGRLNKVDLCHALTNRAHLFNLRPPRQAAFSATLRGQLPQKPLNVAQPARQTLGARAMQAVPYAQFSGLAPQQQSRVRGAMTQAARKEQDIYLRS